MIVRMAYLLVLWWVMVPGASRAFDPPPDLTRLAGEVLEFRIRWGPIPAGTASLEVIPEANGRMRFRAKAQSLPFMEFIYPVQDIVESSIEAGRIRAFHYSKKIREGWGTPRVEEVLFDLKEGTSRRFKNGRLRRTLKVPADVQDPLSCFYWYRTSHLTDRKPVTLAITDGSKLINGTVTILGREIVVTPAGTFQTVIIEPKVEGIGGIFRKSPGARIFIWLTDDRWRRPVKLQSKVSVGEVTVELTGMKTG